MGDEELPQFPARPLKALNDPQSTKSATSGRGTHGLSVLVGLIGFLLGILASHLLSKRSARGHHRESKLFAHDLSSDPVSGPQPHSEAHEEADAEGEMQSFF